MLIPEPIPIDLERLPDHVRQLVSTSTPPEKRLLAARAVVPMPPEELIPALAVLASDPSEPVAKAARTTLETMPFGVLEHGIRQASDPGVLDFLAREVKREGVDVAIASNPNTPDDTFVYLAARSSGDVLEVIANNQQRQMRCPSIIEALYYNPETRMGTISSVLENAVRLGIDLSHIPGYSEIVASIFGEQAAQKVVPKEPQEMPPPEVPEVTLEAPAGMDDLSAELEKALKEAGLETTSVSETSSEEGIDDESFALLLMAATTDDEEGSKRKENPALWTKINSLSVPQKVRLALLGNDFVRSMLIRDPRRVVYMSVMKSPRLTERDIISYSKNKALHDEIIRMIALNREWTKIYSVKHNLATNPKCPPILAMQFLRSLTTKDLKQISISREVPGYIARQAKNILSARETGKREA